MYVLDTVFKDLQSIMSNIVIKYDKRAREYETLDTIRESDLYVSAKSMLDSFHTYQTFSTEVFNRAGIFGEDTIALYQADKYNIPASKRNDVVMAQRAHIIENYTEQNNYYRMLTGLPDIGDFNYVYVDEAICIELGINPQIPIHEIESELVLRLDKRGYLTQIKAENPTKKYLNFLGSSRIDLIRARTSKNFSILSIPSALSESFYEEFSTIYEQCREYYMSVIYIPEYGKKYDLYDNFIALMIMVMTIQRIISNTFKYGIERDFYDLGSIQMMFNAYNVPFIENLPMEYQRILVRNLNNLLRYKSTDKVLYDICSLLGFERINIFKYYLIKEHRLDTNERPIFIYKTEDDDGNPIAPVEDTEAMYNLYFQTVELKERNMALALSNSLTKLDYAQVVVDDPYWWDDDDELKRAIYDSEYNYVETKYLNMNIMYKLTQMLFEVIYVFRMLIEKKDEIGEITIELPKLFERKPVNLFDAVVFLCALISKKNGMAGNIIYTPTKTLSVLGFNFKADFTTIRNYIRENSRLLDQSMLKMIEDVHIDDAKDINGLFENVRALNDFIVAKLGSTQNIDEYRAYKHLHTSLMLTEHTEALFTKSDGSIAETFLDYLDDKDIILSQFVRSANVDQIADYVEHVLFRINVLVSDLKYLYILNDSNNVLLNAAITLIRFFKSYTTDLASFNILYLMDSRYFNMIKMIHDVNGLYKDMRLNDESLLMNYMTSVGLGSIVPQKDKIKTRDSVQLIWEP